MALDRAAIMTSFHAEQDAVFGKALLEVDILVELRGTLFQAGHVALSIGVVIVQKPFLLTEFSLELCQSKILSVLQR